MECKSIVSTFLMSFLIVGLTESQLSAEVGTAEELEEVDKTHGIVRSPLLNVRSGPDEEYEVIGELDDYTRVELEGETSDGWYKINAEEFSDEAYVSASAIVPVDEPEYEEGYVEGDLVNVREGPSEDETDVAQLEQGEQVEVVGEIDDWYKIRVDDVEGSTYVNGSYITSEEPDALDETEESTSEEIQVAETDERTFEETQDLSEPEYSHGIVQSSYLNVRSGPGTDHETIGGLEDYTRVELEGETSDGWYQISGEGFSGDAYVSGDFIVPVDLPEYEEGYVDSDLLNVREGPGVDEARVHQLERNEQLEVVGEIDGWYKLQLDDIDGPTYVSGNHITPEETLELTEPEYSHGIVQSSYLNVRSGPGTDHETIGGLEDYTRVELEGETSDGWYQISGEGFSGEAYVSGDFIVPVDLPEYEEGYVDSDLLNVREGPSVGEARVHQLERNEQLEVVGEIDGWYKLQLDDVNGPTYVSGSYITPEETQELTEPEYSHGVVQSSYLNVRSGPGTDHETIGGLEDYTRVELEGETSDGWYQISGEGFSEEAYVSGDYIVPVTIPEEDVGYVDANISLNVREGPSTSYDQVSSIPRGEQIDIVGEIDGWYKLQLEDVNGPTYVSGNLVTFESFTVGYVDANVSLRVREGPSTSYDQVSSIPRGERVYIVGEIDGWYKIQLEGVSGPTYVSGNLVELFETSDNEHVAYTSYDVVFEEALSTQMNGSPQISSALGGFQNASESEVAQYLNPSNNDRFQHLLLTESVGVSAGQLNNVLSGSGILDGMGQPFIDAGNEHSVNEIYLISHALLETGHGTSRLATGIEVGTNGNGNAQVVTSGNRSNLSNIRTTYNTFGIGAADANPETLGAIYAYNQGWFSPEAAIIGGAEFISQRYVHNDYNQNTLYKMRWNPANPGFPQYATDIGWAVKQVPRMESLYEQLNNPDLYFDIPEYQ